MLGALIVSLLFLGDILVGFQALDDAGRPLPGAVLTFWRSGTTIPKPVYADQELTQQLSDARGRVLADSEGRFPLIYLNDPPYRVQLHTAGGVLRWDVDPYVCDCTDPPYVFRSPRHQALDDTGRPLPGARLTFTVTGTDTPVDVYAEAELAVPVANPLVADAGGFFQPLYLATTELRVRLATRAGEELLDVDPYVCSCGFLLLTSKPYALELIEATTVEMTARRSSYQPAWLEQTAVGMTALGGELAELLVQYEDWPVEETEVGMTALGGVLDQMLVQYEDWPTEQTAVGMTALGGELAELLVQYEDWPVEETEVGMTALGGTLS